MAVALVTGGSGVVGRALVSRLVSNGWEVRSLDRRLPREATEGVWALSGDAGDPGVVDMAVKGVDVIFHLAARMPQAGLDEEGFRAANVEPTRLLASSGAKAGVRRFCFASTIEVYGAQETRDPLDQEADLRFTGTYSRNKYECEQILSRVSQETGLEVVSLRMPMVFGPGFYHEKTILATFVALRSGLPIPVPAPQALVSFVSSRDAAQAFELAATRGGVAGEVFNVAAPDTPNMLQFFEQLKEELSSRSKLLVVPRSLLSRVTAYAEVKARSPGAKVLGTPAELVAFIEVGGAYSIAKARERLGYAPVDTCAQAWAGAFRWFWSQSWTQRYDIFFRHHV
ncbi:NAD(P)-dependent oxidoreductase [Mycobacterium sp.]|uniref:NAD-dependent epimerase/dehydratase family protein n=1 Tax=Mycobacterium sp. TaxID=1785 RepID=UPI00127F1235|nr:NAD-dependent epimerase/dehydratase family protein [Mycobacterium sp.]KAA8957675.1 MAG: NAD-dependent epimerase/dehydratase family protein [Mycobacterium sp.]